MIDNMGSEGEKELVADKLRKYKFSFSHTAHLLNPATAAAMSAARNELHSACNLKFPRG